MWKEELHDQGVMNLVCAVIIEALRRPSSGGPWSSGDAKRRQRIRARARALEAFAGSKLLGIFAEAVGHQEERLKRMIVRRAREWAAAAPARANKRSAP